jgi:hypothetical protein
MNPKLSLVCICVLLVPAGPGVAQTAATGSAVAVEHSVPFGTIPGRLLLLGNYLVFVDEQQPDASFVVARSAIETLNADGPAITVQTSEGIRNRSGEVRRLSFRVVPGVDPAVVTSWYGGGVATASRAAPAAASATPAAGTTSYQVRHNHRFGDCRGRLIVAPDQMSYESVSSVNHSRRWQYRAIKETELSNPYELVIKPFTGGTYKLRFDGTGMDPAAYKELVDRVTASRANP